MSLLNNIGIYLYVNSNVAIKKAAMNSGRINFIEYGFSWWDNVDDDYNFNYDDENGDEHTIDELNVQNELLRSV